MFCDSAGVMYWGDGYYHRIEAANTDGSGRRVILTDSKARYFAFALHAGIIYYTDWKPPYVYLLILCHRKCEVSFKCWRCLCVRLSVVNRACVRAACRKTSKPINVKIYDIVGTRKVDWQFLNCDVMANSRWRSTAYLKIFTNIFISPQGQP